jgi:hypothetical protein
VSSRDRLARMDVDTGWAYHRKVRELRRRYPDLWPVFWTAYLALLGEAWAVGDRTLTLADTYPPSMPAPVGEALDALQAVRIVDSAGRVPVASWRVWYGPVAAKLRQKSAAGTLGAAARWGAIGADKGAANGAANAPHPPNPPNPRRGRARGSNGEPRGSAADPSPEDAAAILEEFRAKFGSPKPTGDPL